MKFFPGISLMYEAIWTQITPVKKVGSELWSVIIMCNFHRCSAGFARTLVLHGSGKNPNKRMPILLITSMLWIAKSQHSAVCDRDGVWASAFMSVPASLCWSVHLLVIFTQTLKPKQIQLHASIIFFRSFRGKKKMLWPPQNQVFNKFTLVNFQRAHHFVLDTVNQHFCPAPPRG